MTFPMILVMVGYALGMAIGQILFKMAARATVQAGPEAGLWGYVSLYLCAGVALYFGLTVLWVWILRSVPLSAAYPFVALAFVFTPLMASAIFGEKLTLGYASGLVLILAGIVVVARQ